MKWRGQLRLALLGGILLSSQACSWRADAEERRFRREREQMKREREAFMKRLVTGRESEEAIQLVQTTLDPDGGLTYKAWAEARLDGLAGSVLFPRWEAIRTSPATYEIWFTYTYVDRENALSNQGYAWRANMMMRTIDPPRKLPEEELAAHRRVQSNAERPPRRHMETPDLE